MHKALFFLIALVVLSCTNKNTTQPMTVSHLEKLKDNFPQKCLKSFVIDSQLQTAYRNYPQIQNKVIDSIIGYGTPYLYSWQKGSSERIAFTTFVDDGELGSRIIYFVFDSKDSLRSATQVANKGGEGGILYETRSRFTAEDTLYKTSAATTLWELSKPDPWLHRLSKSKGDSAFFYLIFQKDGRVLEKQFAEKKELNLN